MFRCEAHPETPPTQSQLSTTFNLALTEREQLEQTWLCLLPRFCTIILFPLLVVIYWGFIKTEWARSQPGSINHWPPPRRPKSTLSPFFPFLHFSHVSIVHLVAFSLIFFPSLSPLWYPLLLKNRGILLQFNLSQCDFVVYFVCVCVWWGRLRGWWVFVLRVVGWLSRQKSLQAPK